MRVLEGVVYAVECQLVINIASQKELFLASENSLFGQFRDTIRSLCAVICIESWWVGSHIKVSYDLEQNATNDETQFDLAVNPL
jgi:hypothetical protein